MKPNAIQANQRQAQDLILTLALLLVFTAAARLPISSPLQPAAPVEKKERGVRQAETTLNGAVERREKERGRTEVTTC
jgi:hypothetical protein